MGTLTVTGKLEVLDARPGWKYVRVGIQLQNPLDYPVGLRMPDACVVVRRTRVDDPATSHEVRATGCAESITLQPFARTRLRAEPVLVFGPRIYETESESVWRINAKVVGVRVNWGEPEDSAEIYLGTVRVVFR